MTGLKTLSSKLPCEPAKPMAASLPMTCTATMVMASACVGFTLPGMMEEPGSFSGRMSSPRPQRGPEASQRMSLAIFMSEAASVLSAPLAKTSSSWAESAANLLGCERKGRLVSSAIFLAARIGEFGMGVEAGADGGAADGEIVEAVESHGDAAAIAVEQIDLAGKFLADGERRGVLQMGAADFYDVGEFFRFGVEGVAQLFDGGEKLLRAVSVAAAMCMAAGNVSLEDCDMLTSSLGWMGFLLPISPPAISMARLEMTSLTFMLVCVPLPVCQMRRGKCVVELSGDDFVGSLRDKRGFLGGEFAEILIDERGSFFKNAESADQLGRHGVLADGEMDQRAGGLRAVVAVGGDVDLAHGVGLGAGLKVGSGVNGFRHDGSWMMAGKSYREMSWKE